jgi:hypothetical protein
MNQVAKVSEQSQQLAQVDQAPMYSMIERAARDPAVDIDKLERLMLMQERAIARESKAAFDASMAELQPELPAIGERGKAIVQGQTRYTFALWEDINAAIKPVLMKHGFALTFRTDFSNGITVTGVLSHRAGHREETSITLPTDASGSKNAVQAVASSVSYGKRYTAGALLNLTSHGEDDDAYGSRAEPDNMASDWISTAEAIASLDDYKTRKAEVCAAYGGATRVPKNVLAAFNTRFAALKDAAK